MSQASVPEWSLPRSGTHVHGSQAQSVPECALPRSGLHVHDLSAYLLHEGKTMTAAISEVR